MQRFLEWLSVVVVSVSLSAAAAVLLPAYVASARPAAWRQSCPDCRPQSDSRWFTGPDGFPWLTDSDGRTYRLNRLTRHYESLDARFSPARWSPCDLPRHLPVPYGESTGEAKK